MMTSLKAAGTSWLMEAISLGHELTALGPVGFAVGGDHALIDDPHMRRVAGRVACPRGRSGRRGLLVGCRG